MSGDSPNAFTSDIFDFKEDTAPPNATTSKDRHDTVVVTASVLVEPPKGKHKDKDTAKEDDVPDFTSLHENRPPSDDEKSLENHNVKRGGDGMNGTSDKNSADGNPGKEPNLPVEPVRKQFEIEEDQESSCVVDCIYYTMECCKCSII